MDYEDYLTEQLAAQLIGHPHITLSDKSGDTVIIL